MSAFWVARSTLAFTLSLFFIWKVISQLRYSSNAVPSSGSEALTSRFSDPFTQRIYSDFEGLAIVVLRHEACTRAENFSQRLCAFAPVVLYHPEVLPAGDSPQ